VRLFVLRSGCFIRKASLPMPSPLSFPFTSVPSTACSNAFASLMGLAAVPLYVIRVRRPQDNGVVERSNGTGKRWSDPWQCHDHQQQQRRIDEEDMVQRELYRDEQGLTRRQRYPDVLHSGRGYAWAWEKACWDLEVALTCLAEHPVMRKVSKQGQVSLYDHHHKVGAAHSGAIVQVRFDVASHQWRFLVEEVEVSRPRPSRSAWRR
jgi:hypothetical protein